MGAATSRRASTRVAAVVLAAGASTRYGGVKQHDLLPAVLAALRETSINEVVVVKGAHELDATGVRVVACPDWERSGASLRCGLAALDAEVGRAVIVLADGPDFDPRAVDRLAAHTAPFAAASYDGTRDHPVALARSAFADVPDEGLRAREPVLVDCSDLRAPGDVDVRGRPSAGRDVARAAGQAQARGRWRTRGCQTPSRCLTPLRTTASWLVSGDQRTLGEHSAKVRLPSDDGV